MIVLIPENRKPEQDLIKLENKCFSWLFRYRNKWRGESCLSRFSFKNNQSNTNKQIIQFQSFDSMPSLLSIFIIYLFDFGFLTFLIVNFLICISDKQLVLGIVQKSSHIILFNLYNNSMKQILFPLIQMRKVRCREAK